MEGVPAKGWLIRRPRRSRLTRVRGVRRRVLYAAHAYRSREAAFPPVNPSTNGSWKSVGKSKNGRGSGDARMAGLLDGDTAAGSLARHRGLAAGSPGPWRAEGARLVLTDVLAEAGQAIAQETGAQFLPADLTQPDCGAARVRRRLGGAGPHLDLRALRSAAAARGPDGAGGVSARAMGTPMLSITLRAGFLLGQAMGRHMRDAQIRGGMLYLTSLHAGTPRNLPHYSAAKAGADHADAGTRAGARPPRHPGQCDRAGCHSRRRVRGRRAGADGRRSRWAAPARRTISRPWRWRCWRTGFPPTSPARQWWSMAAWRCTTGSIPPDTPSG